MSTRTWERGAWASTRRSRVVALVAAGSVIVALGACRKDDQVVRSAAQGDVTLPQQQAKVANATDTTGLPAEGALARVAIGVVAGIGNKSVEYRHQISNSETDELHSTSDQVTVLFDLEHRRAAPLTDQIRQRAADLVS